MSALKYWDGAEWHQLSGRVTQWIPVTDYTGIPLSTSQLTMTADKTGTLKVGMGLKYSISGVDYFGVIEAISTATLTVSGVPFGSTVNSLYWCDTDKVVQIDYYLQGVITATTTALKTKMKTYSQWNLGEARLVQIRGVVYTEDTGANDPKVNITVAGNGVSTANTNAGIAVGGSWVTTSIDINETNYIVPRHAAIELITATGSTGDAADLTVSGVFVLI